MLNTRHPVSIFWGPEALHLFNDAAGQSFGADRRLGAMAQPGAIACDRQRIGKLLSNLLGNAIVYGTPTAPIQVCARSGGGQFELSVSNRADAIEPSALERLFQPFLRGKVRGCREGLGLGLYICAEIAKAHEGTIDVKSDSETTCLTFRMPAEA